MKILLTGAAGQLGSEMAPRLAPYGEVIGIDRAAVPGLGASLQQDLGDAAAVERLLGDVKPALIVNAAAHTAVDRAEEEREQAFRLNAELPAWLARWARINDAPLLHYSTDYVFAGDARQPYTEDHETAPLNVYGESKLAGEQAIEAAEHRDLESLDRYLRRCLGAVRSGQLLNIGGAAGSLPHVSPASLEPGRSTWKKTAGEPPRSSTLRREHRRR